MKVYNELIIDGVTTANAVQYSTVFQTKYYAKTLIYIKEDDVNAIKVTLEARVENHAKAAWVEILGEQTIAKNGSLVVGSATLTLANYIQCAILDLPWREMRLAFYSAVTDTHGKVYAWANRRRMR